MLVCSLFLVSLWLQLTCGEPLFLTPYIKRGDHKEGRRRAQVKPFLPHVKSYSGFLTVDEAYNSNLFFWYFPSELKRQKAPLVLWLQGGPGSSSMFALFTENGPYWLEKGGRLKKRRHSWSRFFNLLYLDNPAGVGFSFTGSTDGYATNQTTVGLGVFEALRQFLLLFPGLQHNRLILSGESYAGKYIPAVAHTILTKNSSDPPINVYGLFVGNPIIDPEDMLTHYSPYLAAHGLLDEQGAQILAKREELILTHMRAHHWAEAANLFESTFFTKSTRNRTLIAELTGLPNHYNMLEDSLEGKFGSFVEFLNRNSTKAALHVRGDPFGVTGCTVYRTLKPDILKSMKPEIGTVLENFRTLIYFGQFDIICPYYLHLQVIRNLDWSGSWEYMQAGRQPLRWKRALCGYYKSAKRYTEVLIRNAGHFTPTDQPQWMLGLLRSFANGDFDQTKESVDLSF